MVMFELVSMLFKKYLGGLSFGNVLILIAAPFAIVFGLMSQVGLRLMSVITAVFDKPKPVNKMTKQNSNRPE
mgnify:FL=1